MPIKEVLFLDSVWNGRCDSLLKFEKGVKQTCLGMGSCLSGKEW